MKGKMFKMHTFHLQNSAYELKDSADAWRSLAHPTPCYPYDPTGMGGYPYGQR